MKIYVIAHKKVVFPKLSKIYSPIQVGAELGGIEGVDWLKDNAGINISKKNKSYNELTGLYWIWKNAKEDIVGICHYRRFFVTKFGKITDLICGKKCGFLEEKHITRMLKKGQMVVHNKTIFVDGCRNQFETTQKYPQDLAVVRAVIEEKYPEYLEAYDAVMEGKQCHLLNMLIAPKALFDEYCSWLFGVLFSIEEALIQAGESEFDRRLGMIGERLMDVWITKNQIKCVECFSINTERRDWKFIS